MSLRLCDPLLFTGPNWQKKDPCGSRNRIGIKKKKGWIGKTGIKVKALGRITSHRPKLIKKKNFYNTWQRTGSKRDGLTLYFLQTRTERRRTAVVSETRLEVNRTEKKGCNGDRLRWKVMMLGMGGNKLISSWTGGAFHSCVIPYSSKTLNDRRRTPVWIYKHFLLLFHPAI